MTSAGPTSQHLSSRDPAEFKSLCDRGCAAFRAGDFRESVELFEQAVKADPHNTRGRKLLGTACTYAGDLRGAATQFQRLTQMAPRDAAGYLNLGAVLNESEEFGGAVRVLKRGLEQTSDHTEEFYYNMGIGYRRMNQPDKAIMCYRECLRVNPEMTSARINLANIYFQNLDYSEALECYSQVLAVPSVSSQDYSQATLGVHRAKAALAAEPVSRIQPSSTGLLAGEIVVDDEFSP